MLADGALVERRSGASLNRGGSRQDFETPPEFMAAASARFGALTFDLAASAANAKAPCYYDELADSLKQPWPKRGLNWLNPPFAHIPPWARKCFRESCDGSRILLLVPASVGSNWYRDNVHYK